MTSRWIKIEYTTKGNAFFRKNNRRYNLNEFMRNNFKHEGVEIHGVMTLTNTMAMGIHISNDGEAVKVYWLA